MSQHCLITKKDGHRIRISIGWDRPLQGYFLNIWQLTAAKSAEVMLYESLGDQTLKKQGYTEDLNDFVTKFEELHIPEAHLDEVLESVHLDGVFNEGSRVVDHTKYITLSETLKGIAKEDAHQQLAWDDRLVASSDLRIFDSTGNVVHTLVAEGLWSEQLLRSALADGSPLLPADLFCSNQALHVFLGQEWIASTCL